MFVNVICMYAFNIISAAQMVVDDAPELRSCSNSLLLLSIIGRFTIYSFEIGFYFT